MLYPSAEGPLGSGVSSSGVRVGSLGELRLLGIGQVPFPFFYLCCCCWLVGYFWFGVFFCLFVVCMGMCVCLCVCAVHVCASITCAYECLHVEIEVMNHPWSPPSFFIFYFFFLRQGLL